MPRVPRYTPQERLRPLPSVDVVPRITVPQTGEAIERMGKQLMGAGSIIAENAMRLQDRLDRAAVRDAQAKFLEAKRNLLLGENGLFMRQGQNALKVYEEGTQGLAQIINDISGSLQNDRQRELFRQMTLDDIDAVSTQLARYQAEQTRKYEAQTQDALIEQLRNDAITNYRDPNAYNVNMAKLENTVYEAILSQGMPEDVAKNKVLAFKTDIHANVLDRFLANDDVDGAKAWYEAHKEEINPSLYDEIEEKIDKAGKTVWRQTVGDQIFLKFKNEDEAIKHVRSNYKGDKEEMLVSYLKVRYAERDEAQRRAEANLFDYYAKQLENLPQSQRLNFIDKLNVKPSIKDHLYTYANKLDRSLKMSNAEEAMIYFQAMDELTSGQYKPEDRNVFLMKYNVLPTSTLVRMWNSAMDGDENQPKRAQRDLSIIHAAYQQSLGGKKPNPEEEYMFLQYVNDAMEVKAKELGRDLTELEKMSIIESATSEVIVKKGWLLGIGEKSMPAYRIYSLGLKYKDQINEKYPGAFFDASIGKWVYYDENGEPRVIDIQPVEK